MIGALTLPQRIGIFVGIGGAILGILNFLFNVLVVRRSTRTKVKVIVDRRTIGPPEQQHPVIYIGAVNMSTTTFA